MASREYTKAELDRMAGAYYTALHLNDDSTTWDETPDWQRHKHRRGVRAMLEVSETITDERMTAWREARSRTRRLA